MSHTRADSKARQNELDRMFTMITDLEGVVTEAISRDQRITAVDGEKAEENKKRFPTLGNPQAGLPTFIERPDADDDFSADEDGEQA